MTRTRIKICGITRETDLQAAVAAGADAVGFVFYRPSPRWIEPAAAARLASGLPPFVTAVGLFVNAEPAEVSQVLATVPLGLLQFHGDETPDYCRQFGHPWMKAVRMKPGVDLVNFAAMFDGASALLADAFVDGYGGGGQVFDWTLLPRNLPCPLVLSGGLDPDNVARAVATVRPWAVDVSSGVEARNDEGGLRKGIKDARRIEAFVAGVRNADAGLSL